MTENKGDLISREALKNAIENKIKTYDNENSIGKIAFEYCEMLIDNAPTVEVPEDSVNCVLTMFGNCSYNKTGCSDCEIKDKIRKALNERPQGKWIKWNFKTFGALGDWEYKCSNCEKVYDGEYNFCPNCGAEMKGKE